MCALCRNNWTGPPRGSFGGRGGGAFGSRGGAHHGDTAPQLSGHNGAANGGWSATPPPASWDGPPNRGYTSNRNLPADQGVWKDGHHIPGQRNARLESELYGEVDSTKVQHTGINFEKYDDIPVDASGTNVPDPITQFTSPPLDAVLLENIGFARYTTPTPVQKYSIPIVAGGRDLMACAQVRISKFVPLLLIMVLMTPFFRLVLERPVVSSSPFFPRHSRLVPDLPLPMKAMVDDELTLLL